jgi:hypothetical protein
MTGAVKMVQMPSSTGPSASPGKADNDLYTVLVCTAFAVVVGTLAFVIYRCIELFGTPFPGFSG